MSDERAVLQKVLAAMERMQGSRDFARPPGYPLADSDKQMVEAVTALRALLAGQQAVAVPPGWKLVPIEPTPEMLEASSKTPGMKAVNDILVYHQLRNSANAIKEWPGQGAPIEQAYRAMLEAATPPPAASPSTEEPQP